MGIDEIHRRMRSDEPISASDVIAYSQHHISAAVAAEREACARKLDELAELSKMMNDHSAWRALRSAADAIRAR